MKKFVIILFMILSSTQLVFAQSVKIRVGESIIETEIVANTETEIYTKNGNFKIKDIDVLIFRSYDDKKLPFYNNLLQQTNIEFEDGKNLNNENIDGNIEKYNSNLFKSPGDYLIDAGDEAIIGVFIPIATAIAVTVFEAPPIVAALGGVAGLGFQISAWIKVKKAGKAMKNNQIKNL